MGRERRHCRGTSPTGPSATPCDPGEPRPCCVGRCRRWPNNSTTRMEVVPPRSCLDDWRQRDADVPVRIPLLGHEGRAVFVCILVEHQSGRPGHAAAAPDPRSPLLGAAMA
jgi:hypothetical protein